jgi:hypothetical protein
MSLFDEFEALKHLPHELAAWVRSLIAKVPEEAQPVTVPETLADPAPVVAPVDAPAAEGQEHA